MISKRETDITEDVIKLLSIELDPKKIILFGSRAKKNVSSSSDFDFAVDCKKPNFTIREKLENKIEDICGLYMFDIVYLDDVENDFKDIILETGKVVYEKGM